MVIWTDLSSVAGCIHALVVTECLASRYSINFADSVEKCSPSLSGLEVHPACVLLLAPVPRIDGRYLCC